MSKDTKRLSSKRVLARMPGHVGEAVSPSGTVVLVDRKYEASGSCSGSDGFEQLTDQIDSAKDIRLLVVDVARLMVRIVSIPLKVAFADSKETVAL